jgi:hypothetical protein
MRRLAFTVLFSMLVASPASAGVSWSLAGGMTAFYCAGTGDDTSAFTAALTKLYNDGGGTLFVKGTCVINGDVLFPNSGGSTPTQPTIRITGAGATANGYWGTLPASPSALDLKYNATVAKLDTRGAGLLEIDHITLKDSSTDCATFIQTTNTTIHIHDVTFSGTHSHASACNDGIVLGGTTTTTTGAADAPFQGYHTSINHNFFDQVRRMVTVRAWANSVLITENTYSHSGGNSLRTTCGSADCGGSAIEVQGAFAQLSGINITNNLIETLYLYNGIELQGANVYGNIVRGNGCWDGGSSFIGCVRFVNGAANNFVAGNYSYSDAYYPQTTSELVNNHNAILGDSTLESNVLPGRLSAQGYNVLGATFSATGCSISGLAGGATAGTFVSGTTGTCTVTITMGGSQKTENAYVCTVQNETTPANVVRQTGSDWHTVTLSGTTATSDRIKFACIGY